MHMYRLEGNYRAIGAEYGVLLRANRVPVPALSATRRKFTEACEVHVRQHAPELLDEIEGLAESSGYDVARVKAAALVTHEIAFAAGSPTRTDYRTYGLS